MKKNRLVILLCLISFLAGAGSCWLYVRSHFRHFPPFDRKLYDHMRIIDLVPPPHIFSASNVKTNEHDRGEMGDKTRTVDANKTKNMFGRIAQFNRDELLCVSVTPQTSVADVECLMSLAREAGLRKIKFLVEAERPDEPTVEQGAFFKEIRIGPSSHGIGWLHYEWYVDEIRDGNDDSQTTRQ